MPKFHFLGGTTNLGRFGTVKRGDVINMTDKEAESILNNGPGGAIDPRFQPFKQDAKIDGAGLDLPEGYEQLSRESQAAERQTAEDRRRRQELLAQATNPRAGVAGAGAAGQPLTQPPGTPLRRVAVNDETVRAPITPGAEKSAETLAAEETARLQRLNDANSSAELEQFRQMTKAELLDVVDEIRQSGQPIDAPKTASRGEILKAVLAAKGVADPEAEEGGGS